MLRHLSVTLLINVTESGWDDLIAHCSELRSMRLTAVPGFTDNNVMAMVAQLKHLRKVDLVGCTNQLSAESVALLHRYKEMA